MFLRVQLRDVGGSLLAVKRHGDLICLASKYNLDLETFPLWRAGRFTESESKHEGLRIKW